MKFLNECDLGITGVDIFGFCCILFILSYLGYIIYYAFGLYGINPFLKPSPLTTREENRLIGLIGFLGLLDEEKRATFFKRVSWFRSKKTFSFKGPVENKEELKLLISGAGALLTLGMKNYKYIKSVQQIVIYPSEYYSIINKKHHLGEYNVGLKTLVFSADTLVHGFESSTDNVNLAIHEFGHALFFETKGKNTWEALRLQWGFKKLKKLYGTPELNKEALGLNYFRKYGNTNVFELFSVLCENFMETPVHFKEKSPEVYRIVKQMLNYHFSKSH
ncbi:zinc-dependent peptidase [Flagellimonas sp. 389]|uniref:zinc-dependent peptidase n=1 Tax=Flagellimonas sp. 389 TaxID=2835862 RepID=UPI001BD6BB88|nr:zinc-dependent peptidase [Flagellimonas sp. 389]MBS9461781.1 zinc-dependent peptidase [Flagellimonas sp. 389]